MSDKTGYIFSNARIATLGENSEGLGLIDNAALAVKNGKIAYVGPENTLPAEYASFEKIDCGNRLITPGLIDCHTHLVHAGNRAHEFELRLNGASYEEVARAGGGIVSSVKNLRAASEDDLVRETLPRLDAL
ncbi:imidazolonepropionase, partial [Agrobacterium sp. S2]|nr:imidazolonepropionase [Agrobacterium sp. S2]